MKRASSLFILALTACSAVAPIASSTTVAKAPQDCLLTRPRAAAGSRRTPEFFCPNPPPLQTITCSFWCGQDNPSDVNVRCVASDPSYDSMSFSCLRGPVAYACEQTGWGCSHTTQCLNYYAADRQQAPKVIDAYIVAGLWTVQLALNLLAFKGVANWAEAATGISANTIQTAGAVNAVAQSAEAASGGQLTANQAFATIDAFKARSDGELAYGCVNYPFAPGARVHR